MRTWQAGFVLAALVLSTAASAQQKTRVDVDVQLKAAAQKELVDGDLKGAIAMYEKVVADAGGNRAVAAKALLAIGQCYEKLGDAEARKAYDRLVREYADQGEVTATARARLAAMAGAATATRGSTLAVRRVWAGADITGRVSADGRLVSFTDWETGNLAVRDLATGQSRLLTDNGSLGGDYAESSLPSPDGKSVAYAWTNSNGRDLRVVGLDGSKPRVLRAVGNGVLDHDPLAWSPDSKQLLAEFVKPDGSRDMMLVTVADGSTKLLKAVGKDLSPGGAFSPDGRYIAWATKEGFSLVDLQTGAESPLIPDRSGHSVLGWAPDGRHILFSSARSGSADAWLIAVADGKAKGEPMFVKKDLGSMPMGFTRTGAFYYGVSNNVGSVQIVEFDPAGGSASSPPQPAFRQGNTSSPAWSPDGRSLAAVVRREPSQALIIRSMDTGEEREIGVGQRTIDMGGIRWTSDGKAIVVPASEPGKGENLFRVDLQSGRVTALMPLPGLGGWPRFQLSRDGNTIFYVRPSVPPADPKGARFVARDLRSGQETTLAERRGLFHGAMSPDGEHLLIAASEAKSQVVSVIPAAGGEAREVVRVNGETEIPFWGSPFWTSDSRHITFLKGVKEKPEQWQVWRAAIDGGQPQRIGSISAGQMMGVAMHPDGHRIAISAIKVDLELWVMENFLPKPASAPGGKLK